MVRRTAAIALPSRRHSAAGSSAGTSGISIGPSRAERAGPMPRPGACADRRWRAVWLVRDDRRHRCVWSGDSSKLRAASDRMWSRVSAAWLPDTRTSTSSSDRTPSVAIFERLAASTHSELGAAVADPSARASRRRTSWTNRAAGRACSPWGLVTMKRPVSSSASPSRGGCGRRDGRPEVTDLSGQRAGGFGGDLVDYRRRRPPPQPRRPGPRPAARAQHHPARGRRRRAVRARVRRTAPRCRGPSAPRRRAPLVRRRDGVDDLGGVGAERGVVQPCGDRDANLLAVHHFLGQRHGRTRQRPAVRDDDEADLVTRVTRLSANAGAAAAISIAADVAPGS